VADTIEEDGTVTADVLGRIWDLTPRRIQQLAKEGIIPKAGRARYPFVAATRKYIQYLRQTIAEKESGGELDPDQLNQFQRRAYYAAEALKLKIGQESGELMQRALVERDYARAFTIMSQFLDTFPDIIEREGVPKEIVNRTVLRIETVRNELAEQLREFDVDDDAVPAGASA
jgi:phage terminase Nu1 subunit (DNA packaging protein)